MKLRYSRRATDDLNAIHEYLNARSPRGACELQALTRFRVMAGLDPAIPMRDAMPS